MASSTLTASGVLYIVTFVIIRSALLILNCRKHLVRIVSLAMPPEHAVTVNMSICGHV